MAEDISMKKSLLKYAELMFLFAVLACLYYIMNGISNVTYFKTKLFQLSIVVLSSGAFIHSWLRWRHLCGQDKNSFVGCYIPAHPSPIASFIWLFWLTSAILAWAIFGQGLWWDLSVNTGGQISHAQATAAGSANVLGSYAKWIGLIIAMVTGFYMVLLHKATERAEKAADVTSQYKKELERISEYQDRSYETLRYHFKFIGEKTLQPLFTYLLVSLEGKKYEVLRNEINKRYIKRLKAEIVIFDAADATDCHDFLRRWNDIAAYQRQGVYDQDDYRYLFRLLRERLETRCYEKLTQEEQEKVKGIKKMLHHYEMHGVLR